METIKITYRGKVLQFDCEPNTSIPFATVDSFVKHKKALSFTEFGSLYRNEGEFYLIFNRQVYNHI